MNPLLVGLIVLIATIGPTEPKRYVEFEDALACVEFQQAKDLLEAYKRSTKEGDEMLDFYEDGRCERADLEGYLIGTPYSEKWINPDTKKLTELNIYHVEFIDTYPHTRGFVVAEKAP